MAPQKTNISRIKSRTKSSALAKAFQMADKDQNGCLNEEEFLKVWRDQGVNISEEAGSAFFREKDKDMDGRISYDEFIGELTEVEKMWSAIDQDEDGVIRPGDVSLASSKYKKSIPTEKMEAITEAFHRDIISNQGEMTYVEFCSVMNGLKLSSSSVPSSSKRFRTGNGTPHQRVVPNIERQRSEEPISWSSKKSAARSSTASSSSDDKRTHYSRHF
ncbi:calmodulin-like protein 5 [Tigriopus californicus]|uniref:calmodulin-like protein 5 n=1 Tax=Tigriopus californicus TaxID=6832 RepID=UPI0027DA9A82|nr:calmodulin-like protein 5 [Tigriopus californicus]